MARTKLEILEERRADALAKYERLDAEIRGLEMTPCRLKCTGCGEPFETEKDFAGHFLVPNEQLLNWGYCPNNPR